MALKAHLETQLATQTEGQIEGRRQSRRSLRLETSGRMPDGAAANVTVHNLSAAGLLLETDLALGVGEVLAVDLPDIGPVGAQIVWQSGELFGCAFEQALGEAALAAAQLRGSAPGLREPPARAPVAKPSFGEGSLDTLGVRLNRLRREKGLTLAQVAAALGVSKPTVWAWEKGKARPLPERIAAIAEVLGVEKEAFYEVDPRNGGGAVVEDCRIRIATEYGTDPRSIRIMIEV